MFTEDLDETDVLIECKDVYKSFGEKHILSGVNFKVNASISSSFLEHLCQLQGQGGVVAGKTNIFCRINVSLSRLLVLFVCSNGLFTYLELITSCYTTC